jgi:hypothetical protein
MARSFMVEKSMDTGIEMNGKDFEQLLPLPG